MKRTGSHVGHATRMAADLAWIGISGSLLCLSWPAEGAPATAVPCAARAKAVIANSGQSVHNANSQVWGDVQAAQAITRNGGTISGTTTPNTPAGLVVVPVPSGATNLGNFVLSGARNFTAGNYVASSFTMNGGSSITVSGGVVQIWVTGALIIAGPANNGGSAVNLEFLVTGDSDAHVNSGSTFSGFIYAPKANVLIDSSVNGSVVGRVTTLNSGGKVLFDAAATCGECTTDADCNDSDPCTADACVAAQCTHTPTACAMVTTTGRGTCALRPDGTVSCWGQNIYGELGNGIIDPPQPITKHPNPTTVPGLSGVMAISSGTTHNCALLGGGTVTCWGGSVPNPTPVPGLTGAIAISAGGESWASIGVLGPTHSCALLSDGHVACWGTNAHGEVGDGTTIDRPSPVVVPGLHDLRAIAAGDHHTCALLSDRTVACWGSNASGAVGLPESSVVDQLTPSPVTGLADVTKLSAGADYSCARKSNGSVMCWGNDYLGQLGDSTPPPSSGAPPDNQYVPVPVQSLSDAVAVSTGNIDTCALRADATMVCWGDNRYGGFGNGTIGPVGERHRMPTPTSLAGIASISHGIASVHSCAILTTGAVYCWGENMFGQVGNGTTADPAEPTPQPVTF